MNRGKEKGIDAPIVKYEDNHLLIVEKPIGRLVQGDNTHDVTLTEIVTEYVRKKYNKLGNIFCHPCHRLDRPTSGLVIFARTSKAARRMHMLFQNQLIQKTYLALVAGTPHISQNELTHWVKKNHTKNKVKAYNEPKKDTKEASLYYHLMASSGIISLLKIIPKTGKSHQIRVQLSCLGYPIQGDIKYGFMQPNADKGINLHAYKLEFLHPVKKNMIKVISKPNWLHFKTYIDELD